MLSPWWEHGEEFGSINILGVESVDNQTLLVKEMKDALLQASHLIWTTSNDAIHLIRKVRTNSRFQEKENELNVGIGESDVFWRYLHIEHISVSTILSISQSS